MFSIKNSFANCSICKLLDEFSCSSETNCKDDLSNVDVIFISESPSKDDVSKETLLSDKDGDLFRKYFNKYELNKTNYLITNLVLCHVPKKDDVTKPPDDVIDLCKINCMNLIKMCNPKLVVLMGSSCMTAFNIAKTGITSKHGNVVEWNGFKTFVMVHPGFVRKQSNLWEPKFEEAMSTIASLLGGNIEIKSTNNTKSVGTGIHRYKIPDQFYTDKYRLIDVQFLNKTQEVLYIFRDNNNNKIYHRETDEYFCYQVEEGVKAKKLLPYEQLNQISIKYKDRYNLDPNITYEGDVRITAKHAMDYYHYTKGEAKKVKPNIMFFDIEVDLGDERCFPTPEEARFPINMITTILNGEKICYVVDNKTEPITEKEGCILKIYRDEKSLVSGFIKDFKDKDPDFITGWNSISFDLFYIFNRLPKLKIHQTSLSKFNEFYVDGEKYICNLLGTVPLDQLFLYKTFTFTKLENYKLGFVSQHELKVTKIQLPLPFNEMYWKMLNKSIEYNIRDTDLLEQLDNKLGHINLINELRVICKTSFDAVSSFGQIDSLMVSYLNSKNISSKNSDPHIVKEKYLGAYVYEPEPGIYDWITDFDFASLYPSIMITYNIGVNSFVMRTVDPNLGYDIAYNSESLPEKIKIIIDPLCDKKEVLVDTKDLLKKVEEDKLVTTINGCFFLPHKKEFSVFGEVVDLLMNSRKKYKEQMFDAIEKKDEELEKFYHTRQLVYKVLANTLYGVVANKAFRFYDLSLAAAITLSGQEALKTSIIEGDAFMRHLDTKKDVVKPKPLTKAEMFAEPDSTAYLLPNRSHEYIVTGDTDSIFTYWGNFKDKSKINISQIYIWCSQIEKYLNDICMTEVVNRHNVDLDFNRLKLKNELVISRGLFLAKKRYAIRVVSNEGKDVDKVNYMGIEIKRSDYPSKSKEFLAELLDLALKVEKLNLSNLLKFVKNKEREFINLISVGDKTVARPVSYTKNIEDYKVISQGVRAMEAWNKIMYNIFQTGAKGYMFAIKGIDFNKIPDEKERERVMSNYDKFVQEHGKLSIIAVPDEEEKLPEFFIPDMKTALKFSFQDRYELMLKPLLDARNKNVLLTF